MRTVTNKNIISMILLRTGTKSIKRFELYENSDQKYISISDEIREGDYNPSPYRSTVERVCSCA